MEVIRKINLKEASHQFELISYSSLEAKLKRAMRFGFPNDKTEVIFQIDHTIWHGPNNRLTLKEAFSPPGYCPLARLTLNDGAGYRSFLLTVDILKSEIPTKTGYVFAVSRAINGASLSSEDMVVIGEIVDNYVMRNINALNDDLTFLKREDWRHIPVGSTLEEGAAIMQGYSR